VTRIAPTCLVCGKAIAKDTRWRWLKTDPKYVHGDDILVEKLPRTKEECQRLVNETVLAVRRSHDGKSITRFSTWDGVSYQSDYFCTGADAIRYAYKVAVRRGAA